MDADDADWLVGAEAGAALDSAAAEADPTSLAAAARMRRALPPQRAALVLSQESLRRRAVAKFGAAAGAMYFTADGLEQATRPRVAAWRAQRFADAGVRRVIDLGCGLGADAGAFLAAGLDVVAVESDPATAALARANLGVEVIVADAVEVVEGLDPGAAVFCDPARRTRSGRSWRLEDLRPPWSFVQHLLDTRLCCVKLGPGLAHTHLPGDAAATWVSDTGDLVELSLWRGGWEPARQAVLLPAGAVLSDDDSGAAPAALPAVPGEVLYEPDPAVIRAGLVDALALRLGARRLSPGIAYLAAPAPRPTPFATAFTVLAVLDAGEKVLRAWVRDHRIGTLEIKKRGVDVDPAVLRRRLKPAGPNTATLVLTPTAHGARALVVSRS